MFPNAVQARETLKAMMRAQIDLRRAKTVAIKQYVTAFILPGRPASCSRSRCLSRGLWLTRTWHSQEVRRDHFDHRDASLGRPGRLHRSRRTLARRPRPVCRRRRTRPPCQVARESGCTGRGRAVVVCPLSSLVVCRSVESVAILSPRTLCLVTRSRACAGPLTRPSIRR